ncbi:MAG: TonB-dependent receptor [Saprospiraceae bacterium]|nr:TonB-dependent receptor [Saprospiraceae bacterium]
MYKAILTLLCINFANYAFSQTSDSVVLSQVIDELEVSAPRWNAATHNGTALTTSLAKKEISSKLIQTSADLLNFSKGVYIQKSQQGGGSPMIRGFSASRLLYVVDGVRMNTAIFRSGNLQNVISIDPYSLERADVIFGPSSVQYGSDAIGGVMSFNTLRPALNFQSKEFLLDGRSVIKGSSGNKELTGHIDFNFYNDKWSFVSGLTFNHFGDIISGGSGITDYRRLWYVERVGDKDVQLQNPDDKVLVPSGYDQYNVLQKVKFQPNKNLDFELIFQQSSTTAFDRYDRMVATRNGNPRYGEWKYGPQKWTSFVLETEYKGQSALFDLINISMAYQQFEESRITRNFNAAERQTRTELVDAISGNIDFSKKLGERHTIWYGGEYIFNRVLSEGLDENIITGQQSDGAPRYPNANWNSTAAYLTGELGVSEALNLTYGLRFNHFLMDAGFNNDFYGLPFDQFTSRNSDLSYSAGISYELNSKNKISLALSKGFRAPNVDDAGKIFESTPGFVVVPNPDLQPEKAYNAELNGFFNLMENFQIDLSLYYTYLDDALVRRNASFNGQDSLLFDGVLSRVQAVGNAAFARVHGVYGSFAYSPMKFLYFNGNINYQKGIEETDDGQISPLRHAPPIFGMLSGEWRKEKWNIGLNFVFNGEVNHDDLPQDEAVKTDLYAKDKKGQTFSPAWTTLNFRSSLQVGKGLGISFGVDNISDIAYKTYASGIAAQGRSFIVALDYKW